eukprot:1410637-Rhodomonas_salina.1
MPPYYARHPSPQAVGPVFFRWVKSATAYQLLHGTVPAITCDAMSGTDFGYAATRPVPRYSGGLPRSRGLCARTEACDAPPGL